MERKTHSPHQQLAMKQPDTRASLGPDPSIEIHFAALVSGVIEAPGSVLMTAETHLVLRIQRRWNEPHTEEGGAESSSAERLRFSGHAGDSCARFLCSHNASCSFLYTTTQCGGRTNLCLVFLWKHSLSIISLILQWSEVALGKPGSCRFMIEDISMPPPMKVPWRLSRLPPMWLIHLPHRNKHRISSGTLACPVKKSLDNYCN